VIAERFEGGELQPIGFINENQLRPGANPTPVEVWLVGSDLRFDLPAQAPAETIDSVGYVFRRGRDRRRVENRPPLPW
jgi:hypothetical protein